MRARKRQSFLLNLFKNVRVEVRQELEPWPPSLENKSEALSRFEDYGLLGYFVQDYGLFNIEKDCWITQTGF